MSGGGGQRWLVLAVLVGAGALNYLDRNVLSFTMIDPGFKRDLLGLRPGDAITPALDGLFKQRIGLVDAAFKAAYALGFLATATILGRVGMRRGFALFAGFWSMAGMATAAAGSFATLAAVRAALALGEAGSFPVAARAIAERFPARERATAFGFLNASGNVGVILAAWFVPALALAYGWRSGFVVTGALGVLAVAAWLAVYRAPPGPGGGGASPLEAPAADVPPSWRDLLGRRETWAFMTAKMLIDPVFWFYLTWLPDFFNSNAALAAKLDLKTIGLPFLVIYVVSDAGSLAFGWLSSRLVARGASVNMARKGVLLLCAGCVVPILLAAGTKETAVAVGLIALAAAAHQGFSAVLFTIATDLFPRAYVPRVVALGGTAGAVAGIGFASAVGFIRVRFGYAPLFAVAAGSYGAALLAIQLLSPRLTPVVSRRNDALD